MACVQQSVWSVWAAAEWGIQPHSGWSGLCEPLHLRAHLDNTHRSDILEEEPPTGDVALTCDDRSWRSDMRRSCWWWGGGDTSIREQDLGETTGGTSRMEAETQLHT